MTDRIRLLTVRDVAEQLAVGQSTVKRAIAAGLLPALKPLGIREWRIHPDDVARLLAPQSQPATVTRQPSAAEADRQCSRPSVTARPPVVAIFGPDVPWRRDGDLPLSGAVARGSRQQNAKTATQR